MSRTIAAESKLGTHIASKSTTDCLVPSNPRLPAPQFNHPLPHPLPASRNPVLRNLDSLSHARTFTFLLKMIDVMQSLPSTEPSRSTTLSSGTQPSDQLAAASGLKHGIVSESQGPLLRARRQLLQHLRPQEASRHPVPFARTWSRRVTSSTLRRKTRTAIRLCANTEHLPRLSSSSGTRPRVQVAQAYGCPRGIALEYLAQLPPRP